MKFEVGEIAILVVDMVALETGSSVPRGTEVEVTGPYLGPGVNGHMFDYVIDIPNLGPGVVAHSDLRKRRPPETPADDEFQYDLGRWLGWEDREYTPLTPAQKAFVKQYGDIQPK